MERDPRSFLLDIIDYGSDARDFSQGKSEADFLSDRILQAALERKLQIIGEAIGRLRALFPDLAARLPGFRDAVGMRNKLVHEYREVSQTIVWATVQDDLPPLMTTARALIDELGWD